MLKAFSPIKERVSFTWKMGGEAGSGIKNSALLLAKAFVRGGYYVHVNTEYPSIVRGGNNILEVHMSTKIIRSLTGKANLLAALDYKTIELWHKDVVKGGAVLVDQNISDLEKYEKWFESKNIDIYHIPLRALLKKESLPEIMINTIMQGALVALVGYDLDILKQGIKEVFAKKNPEIIEKNLLAAQVGFEYIKNNYANKFFHPPITASKRMLIEGTEAIVLGALKGGMTCYVGYPMTPSSGILHLNASLKKKYNLFVYQPEDEISAAQMSLGAWYAGARALTATSGGGFCLMSETIGMAAMTETPFVVVLGQRPGPSTSMPTFTAQGDLRFAIHAGQDEPPRIVLAPGDPGECFKTVFHALNLAQKYQIVVVVLVDKYLLHSSWTHDKLEQNKLKIDRGKILTPKQAQGNKSYARHKLTNDGVSPWVLPGTPGLQNIWRTSSDEHTQEGFICDDGKTHIMMQNKRKQKMLSAYNQYIKKNMEPIKIYGSKNAKVGLITFGSNKGVVLDALTNLNNKIKVIQVCCLWPFPKEEIKDALKNVTKVLTIEGNQNGVFSGLLREQILLDQIKTLNYYDGRPLTLSKVTKFIKQNM